MNVYACVSIALIVLVRILWHDVKFNGLSCFGASFFKDFAYLLLWSFGSGCTRRHHFSVVATRIHQCPCVCVKTTSFIISLSSKTIVRIVIQLSTQSIHLKLVRMPCCRQSNLLGRGTNLFSAKKIWFLVYKQW